MKPIACTFLLKQCFAKNFGKVSVFFETAPASLYVRQTKQKIHGTIKKVRYLYSFNQRRIIFTSFIFVYLRNININRFCKRCFRYLVYDH